MKRLVVAMTAGSRVSRFLRTLVVTTVLALSVPAVGQVGTRLGAKPAEIPSGKISDADRARKSMYSYAECVIERSSGLIEKYLETSPGSEVAYKAAVRLSDDECLSSGLLRFNEALFRGDVYGALYRARFDREAPIDFASVAPIDYAAETPSEGESDPGIPLALRHLADCTVRTGPVEARNLIVSEIATRAEDEAFASVVPNMSACLVEGGTVGFSKPVFRGAVAEALYRLSVSAVGDNTAAKE